MGPHGRFAHGRAHVRQSLEAAGMGLVTIEDAVLRLERDQPVAGLVVSARLGAPPSSTPAGGVR